MRHNNLAVNLILSKSNTFQKVRFVNLCSTWLEPSRNTKAGFFLFFCLGRGCHHPNVLVIIRAVIILYCLPLSNANVYVKVTV